MQNATTPNAPAAPTSPRRPLDVIQIKTPCPADWQAMRGDDRSRFCAHCRRHVHDLSALTDDEATRLICEQAGNLCVRFARDAAGRVMTLDYQQPRPRRRGWRFWGILGIGGAVASWTVSLIAGTSRPRPAMGAPVCTGIIPPPPTTMPSSMTTPGTQYALPATNPTTSTPSDDAPDD